MALSLRVNRQVLTKKVAIARGFEPPTVCLEGRCSIQLSYAISLSGWQDSNLRPPGPKPGAITGLRYTPKTGIAERPGLEPGDQITPVTA